MFGNARTDFDFLAPGLQSGCQPAGLCREEAEAVHDHWRHGPRRSRAQHLQRHVQAAQGQEEEPGEQDGEESRNTKIWITEREGKSMHILWEWI